MVNEIELYVCDEDGLVLLGDGEDHICMQCEKPMVLAKFERKLTKRTLDDAQVCGLDGGKHDWKGNTCMKCRGHRQ